MKMTAADIIREVRKIAAEKPAVFYTPPYPGHASYIDGDGGGAPGCIIGQAMLACRKKFGEQLVEFDRDAPRIKALMVVLSIKSTTQEACWLNYVQQEQDRGRVWGKTVELANKKYPLEVKSGII